MVCWIKLSFGKLLQGTEKIGPSERTFRGAFYDDVEKQSVKII